jgi:aspartokinase
MIFSAVSEAVILKTLSYQEAWEMVSWTMEILYDHAHQNYGY